jgi:hypothetical protein
LQRRILKEKEEKNKKIRIMQKKREECIKRK